MAAISTSLASSLLQASFDERSTLSEYNELNKIYKISWRLRHRRSVKSGTLTRSKFNKKRQPSSDLVAVFLCKMRFFAQKFVYMRKK